MNKILLNILTHGDELAGKRVADGISERYPQLLKNGLDIIIANELAYQQGKRYVDSDLNRVFPGKPDGNYEERRAYELAPIVSSYDFVIDVHSTESGTEDTVIVTKIDEETKDALIAVSPRYILFMNIKPDKSLISRAKVGIAFEMGKDADEKTVEKTMQGIESLLTYAKLTSVEKTLGHRTEAFEVFQEIVKPKNARLNADIKNFHRIETGSIYAKSKDGSPIKAEFDFYPVIFGNDNYETIFGFAARKIDF